MLEENTHKPFTGLNRTERRYTMPIGWIDFSRDERNKVLNVIHLLDEPGAIDELGIGAIRDAFADCFLPYFTHKEGII